MTGGPNGHQLIGYWSGLGTIRDISPQWDVIIVAFATPERNAPEGTMQYRVRGSMTEQQFIDDIKYKQSQGKKVMISLGGGGLFFKLNTQEGKDKFIRTVEQICEEYGFDGVDIDFESPSMDARRRSRLPAPHLAEHREPDRGAARDPRPLREELHDEPGAGGPADLGGRSDYGGQFGSYVPIIEGVRDILSFTDTQDYNCPPIEGLDGEYYMPGSVDYHAAATEQFLHGFTWGAIPSITLRHCRRIRWPSVS